MFSFNPELAQDNDLDDDDGAFVSYEREDDDDDEVYEYKELDYDALALEAQEVNSINIKSKQRIIVLNRTIFQVDDTGTIATEDRLKKSAADEQEAEGATGQEDVVDATPFNENLFLDEEVLDGLEDELNELDLNDNS